MQEASGISAPGFVAAGLSVTAVAASYQALSPEGVRFVPVAGHQRTRQVARAADNTSRPASGRAVGGEQRHQQGK